MGEEGDLMLFRRKPIIVEAHQFVDGCWAADHVPSWYTEAFIANQIMHHGEYGKLPTHATIKTLEGEMRAERGDWIIRGVKGELYPCKPDIFKEIYEAV